MRLATFKTDGRISYGAVTDNGIIDLGRKLPQYPTLLDVFRAQALAQARAAATGRPDYQVKDVEMLPPILAPDKNICVGINYPDLFCRFPTSLVGSDQAIVRLKVTDKFDYEYEIVLVMGKDRRHVPRQN